MRRREVSAVLLLLCGALPFHAFAAEPYYPPLSAYVESDDVPQDGLAPADDGGTSLADRLRVKSFLYSELSMLQPDGTSLDIGAEITAELLIEEGFELVIPGLEEAFTLVVGEGEFTAQVTAREVETEDPTSPDNFPFIADLSTTAFPVVLRLNDEMFKPVQPGTFEPFPEGTAPDPEISLGGATAVTFRVGWDGETDIDFSVGGGPPPSFSLNTPVSLGDTGIILDVSEVILDLSETSSPPGIADPLWRGIKLGSFAVHWTNGLEVPDAAVEDDGAGNLDGDLTGVTFTDFLIGTGGFSGTMCGNGLNIDLTDGLFGMDFEINDLCVGFTQNALSEAGITGTIEDFPYFEADIELRLALDMDGNFAIGVADPGGGELVTWEVQDVLAFHLESVAFESREGVFLTRLNGDLEPLFLGDLDGVSATESDGSAAAGDFLIPVNGLTITSEGDVSIDGGWITLPQKRYIDFKAFQVTLSQIGFGKTEGTTEQSWFGFTGGVELVEGLDTGAEFKRLQFLWPALGDGPVDIRLQGVSIAFEQPGVLRFEGSLEWFETEATAGAPGTEGFAGKMELALIALNNMTIASRVVVGSADHPDGGAFKFFYLDLETQFPAGIPVFAGISIYGISGLFAYNMSPNITAFTSPVEWFNEYRAADNIIAGAPPPWEVRERALALGAGVIFGTQDDGFTVNAKVALTIAVPGPVVMLNGMANILKPRAQLSNSGDTPDFTALAIYDGAGQTFLVNIGAAYELLKVIEVSGEAEAFFNLADPGDWHLYLGQKEPEDKRITATVLSLVQASSYYMIDPDKLQFGSKLQYGDRWKFGPLRVTLMAWFSYDAGLSWRPIQIWGEIDLGGEVELSAFGVGLGLSVSAGLGLEAPKPYNIEGDFKVKLNLPWPLPDPKATVHLQWHQDGSQRPLEEVMPLITLHDRKRAWVIEPELEGFSDDAAAGSPSASVDLGDLCEPGESIPRSGSQDVDVSTTCGMPLVPLDTFVSVAFERSMNDPADLGLGNPYPADESQRHRDDLEGETDQHYQYDATDYELLHHPKDAATVTVDIAPSGLYGSWTSIPSAGAQEGVEAQEAHTSLDILSKNPFRFYDAATTLGYDGAEQEWTDWAAQQGNHYCIDQFKEIDTGLWDNFHQSAEIVPLGQLDCPVQVPWMEEEDFVLPPYSVFRFVGDAEVVEPDGSDTYRRYRDAVYFHTEGPPLVLDDYVDVTVPEFPHRPHYRDYDVAIRFNENYMNKLYQEGEEQALVIQVLDENENPVAVPGEPASDITTVWDEAPDTLLTPSEEAWVGVLEDLNVLDPNDLPKDDLIYGEVRDDGAVRPGQRHLVRVWLEDPRLTSDTRLDDDEWMAAHNVRHVSPDSTRAVLYEYDLQASRYGSMSALLDSYAGTWFGQNVAPGASLAEIGALSAAYDEDFPDGSFALANGDSGPIGLFLRHLLSPSAPTDVTPEQLTAYAQRTPGYTGDAATLSAAQWEAIRQRWTEARENFETIEGLLELGLDRLPLPEEVEITVLRQAGHSIGYLIEFPEAVDLSRIAVEAHAPGVQSYRPVLVPSADDTRLFVFRRVGGLITPLEDGLHVLTFTFHGDLGDKNPVIRLLTLADTESYTYELMVPEQEFVGEAAP